MSGEHDIPERGTPEYRWWLAGARAEAQARNEGRTEEGRQVYGLVDVVTKDPHFDSETRIAWLVFDVFALAGLPLHRRLRWAWRVLRG